MTAPVESIDAKEQAMESFQQEVPKSRVNITLDVETGDARKTLELPLKMLVLGDFSNGQASGRLAERERVPIDRGNLDAVLGDLHPSLQVTVPNTFRADGSQIRVSLSFDGFDAFTPEAVARQIPQVNNLLAMRNLLKDLKSNVLDNARFRRELERIVQNQQELEGVMGELQQIAPLQTGEGGDHGPSGAATDTDGEGQE
ncbi:MAG: type VI secretion system contractile sheath small subunit [Halorhodospira halophila]|uniref:type VI secretion system contractile sheath small subunit n=2 Tax=Ectothiorhodospiraceae TaxID=72276 RepID=UPI001914119B|nr:type VI secretion system contractile sheath small subunit [Halorhodospira halophila]MCC3750607.1 type VI secretion system contractile sheath small subunit [Halorhodospira halophila]MCG5543929.1 type VI secretion system contractile sheath small subunit [Halorhodospira sp. 9628]